MYPSYIHIYRKLVKKGMCNKTHTFYMVRLTGLEPARLSAPAPQAGVSTNLTTDAYFGF